MIGQKTGVFGWWVSVDELVRETLHQSTPTRKAYQWSQTMQIANLQALSLHSFSLPKDRQLCSLIASWLVLWGQVSFEFSFQFHMWVEIRCPVCEPKQFSVAFSTRKILYGHNISWQRCFFQREFELPSSDGHGSLRMHERWSLSLCRKGLLHWEFRQRLDMAWSFLCRELI